LIRARADETQMRFANVNLDIIMKKVTSFALFTAALPIYSLAFALDEKQAKK
jgi:hypothetical protein